MLLGRHGAEHEREAIGGRGVIMNRRTARLFVAASTVIIAFAAPTLRAAAAEEMNIEKMIATAKTASDHQAIADYYKQQAAEARSKADMHKTMAERYSMSGIGNQATKTHFHQHCEALVRSYEAEAKEYDALAKAHHDMAVKAGK
jgi:hypothetical protein